MMEEKELLDRLATLEAENLLLRARLPDVPAAAASGTTEEVPAAPKPSSFESRLGMLERMARDLALPNDPAVDQILQTARRTQALATVVAEVAALVLRGFGGTGAFFGKISGDVSALRQEIAEVRALVESGAIPAAGGEVGASAEPSAEASSAPEVATIPRGINGAPRRRAPVAPVAPVQATPTSAPVGMPAAVAALPQVPLAPVASVSIKP